MESIIIVCAGMNGREALSIIEACNQWMENEALKAQYKVLGFIDDNLQALEGTGIQVPILGKIADWQPIGDEQYVIGSAIPATKEKLVSMLKQRGCRFMTLIAPWTLMSRDCELGEGCFVEGYSISAGVKIGNFVNVNASMIAPGAVIGDYTTTTGFAVVENAVVGKRVFIGSNTVITSGVHVGDDVQVSAGSIVTDDVPAGATVFGVPARQI